MVSVSGLRYGSHTIESIYGKPLVDIPTGYEFVGFYTPREEDKFISNRNTTDVITAKGFWASKIGPRIIVKQIASIEETLITSYNKCFSKTWTIKEIYGEEEPKIPNGYEVIEFHIPKLNDNFLSFTSREVLNKEMKWDIVTPRLILRKQKKLYAKLPLTDFKSGAFHNRVKFKTADNYDFEVDFSKEVEIIEE